MIANVFFAFLSAMTWKGSLLVAALLLIVTLFVRWIPAGWRYALVLVALLRLVIPAAPSFVVSVLILLDMRVEAPFLAVVPAPSNGQFSTFTIPRQAVRPLPVPASSNTTKALISIWAAGVAFALIRVGRRSMRVSRRLAHFRDVTRPDLLELL